MITCRSKQKELSQRRFGHAIHNNCQAVYPALLYTYKKQKQRKQSFFLLVLISFFRNGREIPNKQDSSFSLSFSLNTTFMTSTDSLNNFFLKAIRPGPSAFGHQLRGGGEHSLFFAITCFLQSA